MNSIPHMYICADKGSDVKHAFNRNIRYLVTATFDYALIDSQEIAERQTNGILHDFMHLANEHEIDLTICWSLVYHNQSFHSHFAMSWLPTSQRTYLTYRRMEVNRAIVMQILHDNGSYTDSPQKRVKPISAGTSEPTLDYVTNQPNGGDVIHSGWHSKYAVALQYDNFDSCHYSSHDNLHLRKCSVCGLEKVADTGHFYYSNAGGYFRGECVACHNLKSAMNLANSRATIAENRLNLPIKSLGRISTDDISTLRQNAVGRCYWFSGKLYPDDMCIDHIEPLSKGGMNTVGNLCITSRRVNSMKGDMSLEQWLQKLGAKGVSHELHARYPDIKIQLHLLA